MMNTIEISDRQSKALRRHLFQNDLEQGAFLFAREHLQGSGLKFVVEDLYLIPATGWETQMEVYLEMKDSERSKIMQLARETRLCAIDCHSHPHAEDDVWFSPSDVSGIRDFAQYAKWKLDGRPFAAMVWAERSLDAVLWRNDFANAERIHEVRITGGRQKAFVPLGTWFQTPRGINRYSPHD